MKNRKKLVFATNNSHKLQEARQIISDAFEIVSLAEIGCHDDIPETAETLEGNALIKARWVRERYGYDCFADDTGLMVDALDGAPGVYSARYAGEHCSPADNVARLLDEMEGEQNRDAHFATVIALSADGGEHVFEGRVDGEITEAPRGEGGFGYDPVFMVEKSGKCFAEMTAEEKNAVSHRGRAMRKLCDFLGCLVVLALSVISAFGLNAAEWRQHGSYDGQVENIAETPDYVYFLGTREQYDPRHVNISNLYGILFRYSKEDGDIKVLDSGNLLSGNLVRCIAYNYDKKYLCVALDDGMINLLYDNGDVRTIPALQLADASLDKNVNDLTFDPKNNRIVVSTNFGILLINDASGEVETSRILNEKINSAVVYRDLLWLATNGGAYYGNIDSFGLSDMKSIPALANLKSFVIADDELYSARGDYRKMALAKMNYDGQAPHPQDTGDFEVFKIVRGKTGFTLSSPRSEAWVDSKGISRTVLPVSYENSIWGSMDGKSFWVSSGRNGFSNVKLPGDGSGKWTILSDNVFPNVSTAFMCWAIVYSPEYGMLVRNHGYDYGFGTHIYAADDLVSGYKNMTWTPLSATYRTDMPGLAFDNPFGLTIDPNNPDHIYCGSERSGMLRLDLKNPEKSIHFSKPSDMLGGNGKPGFVALVPDNDPNTTWGEQCVFAEPNFDSAGNLWTAFVNPEGTGEPVSSYTELWVWPAAERAASADASSVRGWKKIRVDGVGTGNRPMVLPLKSTGSKNLVLHTGNTKTQPVFLLDNNGTIDNTSDDKIVTVKTITDQDGNSSSFNNVVCWLEDTATGLVWVSTASEIFTFNPQEWLTNPGAIRKIKVPRNDGTNLADYLLEGVTVNSITIDASGRKWFGTTGAGLVCTSGDGREIIASYTPEDSEIAGSSVFGTGYNPSTNSLMVSTERGLCELFLSGSATGGSESDVRCYPNPVRPDYFGYVTIDGLQSDAMVKIVDTAGNLIKECGQAQGGVAQWDVTNMNFKRVPGGVYFVVAGNGPNDDSYAKVSKILVVN